MDQGTPFDTKVWLTIVIVSWLVFWVMVRRQRREDDRLERERMMEEDRTEEGQSK